MSLLSQITKTNKQTGIKAVIYGATGMGKTTLACSTPKPLLIPTEGGYTDVDPEKVAILPQVIRDFDVLTNVLKDLVNCYSEENGLVLPDGREIKSIVLDSITATERLIHDKIIRSDKKFLPGNPANVTMESAINGYSSAYNSAAEKVSELLRRLEYFSNRGINVIIIAHSISYLEKDIAMGEEYTYTDCAFLQLNRTAIMDEKQQIIRHDSPEDFPEVDEYDDIHDELELLDIFDDEDAPF